MSKRPVYDDFDWDSLPPAVPFTTDARQLWPTETGHLTPWVIDNLDLIGRATGLNLDPSTVRREVQLGQLYVDILVEDRHRRVIAIESQFGPSDHDHFARLVIYACEASAAAVIWVVAGAAGRIYRPEPIRSEHQRALGRLNAKFADDIAFYGVAINLEYDPYSQSDSDPSWLPHLMLVVAPRSGEPPDALAVHCAG